MLGIAVDTMVLSIAAMNIAIIAAARIQRRRVAVIDGVGSVEGAVSGKAGTRRLRRLIANSAVCACARRDSPSPGALTPICNHSVINENYGATASL